MAELRHPVIVDGREHDIVIWAMDEGFIVRRKTYSPPLTRENIGEVNPGAPDYLADHFKDGRFQITEAFFRQQIQVIGSCMLLASDSDGVIGKMHFTTREMHQALGGCAHYGGCYCVGSPAFPADIQILR